MPLPEPTAPAEFRRQGKTHQLRIESAQDLRAALELDDAHWMATSARIASFAVDLDFLNYVDSTGDGRIRAREVRRSLRFLLTHLRDYQAIDQGRGVIALAAIDPGADQGAAILDAATKIVGNEASTIDIAQVQQRIAEEVDRGFTGAGLLVPARIAKHEPEAAALLEAVLATVGGAPHPEVEGDGVRESDIERFYNEAQAYLAWLARVDAHGTDRASLLPLGEATRAGWAAVEALDPKIGAWFALCDAARLDPRVSEQVWPHHTDLKTLQLESTEAIEAFVRDAPLSKPDPSGVLTPDAPINPAWADVVAVVFDAVTPTLLPQSPGTLDRQRWRQLMDLFGSYADWSDDRPDTPVETMAPEQLRAFVDARDELAPKLDVAFRRSREGALELKHARLVERLLLLSQYMLRFANSFVSFRDLYDPERRALFEEGTFVVDGRRLKLSVQVFDRARHKSFSDSSNMFVLYIHVGEPLGGDKFVELAVPVTSGGRGTLIVGKHGVFHSANGDELLATIVEIVDNPISLSEAIAAPFKRMGNVLSQKIEGIGEAKEDELADNLVSTIDSANRDPAADNAANSGEEAKGNGGLLAGGAIGIAALGSATAFITKTLAGLQWVTVVGILLGIVLAVLLPVAAIAWFKLHRRDLSALLEGSDFGVNAQMRMTMGLAREFTRRPKLPVGAVVASARHWGLWLLGLGALGGVGALIYYFVILK